MRAAIQYIRSFLTENKTSKQTVIKNTFWLFVAEAVSKGSIAVVIILIGRFFGKEIFGQWSYLSVILTFLLVFADLGITQLTIRDRQHLDETTRPAWLRSGLITKALLSIGVIIVYLGILWRQADSAFLRVIGLILLFQGIANSFLEYLRATFRSLQRSEVETRIKLRQGVGNLFLIPLLWVTRSLPLVLLGQGIIILATCGYAWWITHQKMHFIASNTIVSYNTLIQQGWMFALSGLFVSMYYYVDSLIIQWYHGYEAVGVYSAAYKILYLLIYPVALLGNSILVEFKKLIITNNSSFLKRNVSYYICGITLFYFFINIIIFLFGNEFILFTYGNQYSATSEIFQYLSISLIFIGISNIYTRTLYAYGKQKYHFISTSITLFINIVLNFILIPKLGINGAIISTIFSEFIALLLLYYFYLNLFSKND